jgi:ferrochelatase
MDRSPDTRFEHDERAQIGVLLVNLGTPDEPTTAAVRCYLREFLSDSRVIEIPRFLWMLILNVFILPFRPKATARNYKAVWTADGSPLLTNTMRQAEALQAALGGETRQEPVSVVVEAAMRYGNPSIQSVLERLRDRGVHRILLLPMYPQYSAATTATVFDAVAEVFSAWRWIPELRTINHYHDDPAYIAALSETIERAWRQGERGEQLIFSFHGMPRATLEAGDPYHCECQKTARLVAERLGLADEQWRVTFQSRFGRAQWLEPYTIEHLKSIALDGIHSVDVVCPGFSSDCIETLEEIDMQNRNAFIDAGGKKFRYIAALNDQPSHIEHLSRLVLRHLGGWLDDPTYARSADDAGETRRRAIAMGARR